MRTQTTLTPVSAITDIQICARPNAARMITRALIERAKMMLPLTVLITLLAIFIPFAPAWAKPLVINSGFTAESHCDTAVACRKNRGIIDAVAYKASTLGF